MGRRRMLRLVVLTSLAALAAFATLSAASASGTHQAVIPLLRVGEAEVPPGSSLDPAHFGGLEGPNTIEYLMKLGPQGQVLPNLAQSVTQPGKAVYVYHIRHGIKFWDGNELTA